MLTINPSYQTDEVTYGSCPCNDSNLIAPPTRTNDQQKPPCQNWGSSTQPTTLGRFWTRNVPLYHGDSVLGTFGVNNTRFSRQPLECVNCEKNCSTMSALFYKPVRQYTHPTYGFQYMGKDNYYRKPY